jgi:alkylhydroperoxidase/carboxymuconolactone decarboxylase family protein YurZ
MQGIESLVPGFQAALDSTPGARASWNVLASSVGPPLSARDRALAAIVVARRTGCEYARWVMGRLGSRAGLSAEEILLADAGTGCAAHTRYVVTGASAIARGGSGPDALERAVSLALLACAILHVIAPAAKAADMRRGA